MRIPILSFQGKADRSEWWTVTVIGGLVTQLSAIFAMVARFEKPEPNWLAFFGLLLLGTAALWATVAVTAKRFRDRGVSPWFTLMLLVPVIGELWVLVVCGFLPHPHRIRRRTVVRTVTGPSGD